VTRVGRQYDRNQSEQYGLETSVSDTEMDTSTSSDGGSTVRELNEQLLAGEDNTGSVSTESVVPGNTHSADDHGEWTTVTRNKRKNDSKSSDTSAPTTGTAKKGRMDSGLIVYLEKQDFDIVKEASKHPLEFSR